MFLENFLVEFNIEGFFGELYTLVKQYSWRWK